MKKIFVLAMLCVFSIVGVQAAEAKTPDKEMKNRPQIEKQFEKKQTKDFNFEDKKYKKQSYDKKNNKFEKNNKYAKKDKLGKHCGYDGKKIAHYKKHHSRGHKISHYKKKHYYSHNNNHRNFNRRHSFYR